MNAFNAILLIIVRKILMGILKDNAYVIKIIMMIIKINYANNVLNFGIINYFIKAFFI